MRATRADSSQEQRKLERRFDAESQEWREKYLPPLRGSLHYDAKLYRREQVLELLGRGAGRALDLGCGAGMFFEAMHEAGFAVVGVDYAMNMVRLADAEGRRSRAGPALRADALQLPFGADAFDALVCVGLVEYFPEDPPLLREIYRVVKPSGRVVITLRNKSCLERRYWKLLNRLGLGVGRVDYYYREHDAADFRARLEEMGFTDYDQRLCHFYPLPWPASRLLKPLDNLLARGMERLFSRSSLTFLASTVVCGFRLPPQKQRLDR